MPVNKQTINGTSESTSVLLHSRLKHYMVSGVKFSVRQTESIQIWQRHKSVRLTEYGRIRRYQGDSEPSSNSSYDGTEKCRGRHWEMCTDQHLQLVTEAEAQCTNTCKIIIQLGQLGQVCWTHEFWNEDHKHSGNQSVWTSHEGNGPCDQK